MAAFLHRLAPFTPSRLPSTLMFPARQTLRNPPIHYLGPGPHRRRPFNPLSKARPQHRGQVSILLKDNIMVHVWESFGTFTDLLECADFEFCISHVIEQVGYFPGC